MLSEAQSDFHCHWDIQSFSDMVIQETQVILQKCGHLEMSFPCT